ncbi:MAG: molybdopterin molybdotransferase MoeA, partial [Deltaproteobacteria bacterium]|nr:molybdopterin molybdotransferase MoeA [Deltaproteobacteria bacterium]
GEAARIMTGAPIPEGADAVVKVEETTCDDADVRISAPAPRGDHIRYAGEDVAAGDLIIRAGTVLRPAEVGMLAALGRSSVKVYRCPLVAIIPTGDELVDIDEAAISPEKIVSSNSYSLAAQVTECGGIPLRLGIAKDSREDLTEKFRAALRADVIVSSAGVSVGDYDFVKDVMEDVGITIEFWQVAERPGKPMTFGSREGVPVFGLPGNPVSSMITFEEYVRPAILKMTGHRNIFRRTIRATVAHDIEKKQGLRYFFRSRVQREGDGFVVEITGEQGSGILRSMVLANGIMVIPEDVELVKAGDQVMVQLIDDSQNYTKEPEYLSD